MGLAVGSFGFLVSWAAIRGIATSPGSATIYGGFFAPIALLVFATASIGAERNARRLLWAVLAGLGVATAILTGTRSFILAIPAVLITIVLSLSGQQLRLPRLAAVIGVTVLGGGAVTLIAVAAGLDVELIADRWSLLGSAIADPSRDMSVAMRISQTDVAWRLFQSSPIFGIPSGLGVAYRSAGGVYATDTPVALFAGLGIAGFLAVLAMLAGWAALARTMSGPAGWPRAAMVGTIVAAVTFALILPIVEDKGVGFSFVLIGAPALRVAILRHPVGRNGQAPREKGVDGARQAWLREGDA
jgi:hypothetical protein